MDTEYLRTYAQSADDNTLAAGLPLTETQKHLIAKVDEVGPTWAQRAFKHDREASFPVDNWNDLRQMGFLGLCVPQRLGGMGADYRTYMLVALFTVASLYCFVRAALLERRRAWWPRLKWERKNC